MLKSLRLTGSQLSDDGCGRWLCLPHLNNVSVSDTKELSEIEALKKARPKLSVYEDVNELSDPVSDTRIWPAVDQAADVSK